MTGDAFEIPGMPTLRSSVVPPTTVNLPMTLVVRPRFYIVIGTLYVLATVAMATTAAALFARPPLEISFLSSLFLFGVQLLAVAATPYLAFAGWRTLRDGFNGSGKLVIGSTGLADTRAGLNVGWKDIISARRIDGRANNWGVSLVLRDVSLLPKSRWLRGFGWLPRKPDEVHIQTIGMTKPSYIAQASIFHLVKQAGGTILPPRQPGWLVSSD